MAPSSTIQSSPDLPPQSHPGAMMNDPTARQNEHQNQNISTKDIPSSIYQDYLAFQKKNPHHTQKICYLYSDFRIAHLGFQTVTVPEAKFVCFRKKSPDVIVGPDLNTDDVEVTVSKDMNELHEFIQSIESQPQDPFPYHQKTIQPPFPRVTPAIIRKQQTITSNSTTTAQKEGSKIKQKDDFAKERTIVFDFSKDALVRRYDKMKISASNFLKNYYDSWITGRSAAVLSRIGWSFVHGKPIEIVSRCFSKFSELISNRKK